MKVVRAQAQDGRVFRAANDGYLVTGKAAGDPGYYRDFNRIPLIGDGTTAQLTNPYRESVWVQSAINTATRPLKAVTLKFYRGDTEVTAPDLLRFWKRPAKGLSYEEFIDATAGWFKLAGEFFWVLGDEWLTRAARKQSFLIVRPQDMRPIEDTDGELVGWELKDRKGRRHHLIPDQVIQIKRWNPNNPHRGLGELASALLAAESDYLAGKYNRDTYANAGDHGDYIVAKGGLPSDPQREQIVRALREKRAAKLRGDFKPVFLTGDIEVKSPAITAPDAAFVANRVQNRHEIYAAFGIPMSMADVQASYSIGSASDYFRMIFDTCLPLGTSIEGAIDKVNALLTGRDELESYFDWDEHPVMQAVRNERTDSAVKFFGMGVPVEQLNDYFDLGLKPFPGWDVSYLPFSLAPAGTLNDPATDANLAELPPEEQKPTGEDAATLMLRILEGRGPKAKGQGNEPKARDPRRVAMWRSIQAKKRSVEAAFESKFGKQLMKARAEVLRKLAENGPTLLAAGTGVLKAVSADFLYDAEEWEQEFIAEMTGVSRNALNTAGKQLFEEIDKDDPFTMPPARALTFIRERSNLLSNVSDEVFATVKESLEEGLLAGESIAQIRDRVKDTFNGISKARATTIAQTETAAAYGTARDEAMKQAGVQWKQWLTSGNDNVRDSHLHAEGQTVPLDQPFKVGNAELMFPGDPSGPPEEVINCRCVQIAVAAPTEEGEA
jgi:SPP1 gp7 family putative phage head morphogenesis protein